MKTKLGSMVIAGAVAIALMAGGAGTAVAAGDDGVASSNSVVATDGTTTSQVTSLSAKQIEEADTYVTRTGDAYRFDKAGADKQLDSAVVDEVERAVNEWNSNIGIDGDVDSDTIVPMGGDTVIKGKHGSITSYWWGLKIKMDSYLAGKVAGGTATAAGIAAGIGLASASTGVGGIAGAAVSTALGIAGGMLQLCRDANGSLTYYFTPVPPGGACNPFA